MIGDIVKMKGLKISEKVAIYHHHALFTDAKRFKVKIFNKFTKPIIANNLALLIYRLFINGVNQLGQSYLKVF